MAAVSFGGLLPSPQTRAVQQELSAKGPWRKGCLNEMPRAAPIGRHDAMEVELSSFRHELDAKPYGGASIGGKVPSRLGTMVL